VFDYARDYLGLLKAAVIASGIIPPGMEGSVSGWKICSRGWWDRVAASKW